MTYKVTLLPGDGIGTEIIEAAVRIIDFVAEKNNVTLITY